MRIAIFSDYFPPHIGGGVERVVYELGRRLAARGVDVRVFTLNTAGAPAREMLEGMRVYRSPALNLTGLTRLQSAVAPALLADARRELGRDPPDLIHANGRFFFSSLVAMAVSGWLRHPLVTTLHVGAVDCLPPASRLAASAYERIVSWPLLARSHRITAVSEAVAAHAIRLGANPERIQVLPNGVDCDTFSPPAEPASGGPVFAFVGRLIQNKGPQYLMEALPRLKASHPDARTIFIGDGPLRPSLEARARTLGLDSSVSFVGTRDDVADLLRESHIFVRPSLSEGMSLTVLEAMACSLPVVATPVGGTAEVVRDDVNGLLVETGDVSSLGNALTRLAADGELRRRLGANGRRAVLSRYSWDRTTDGALDIYEEVLGRSESVLLEAA